MNVIGPSKMMVDDEEFLVEPDGPLIFVYDLNGSCLFDVPSDCRLEMLVAATKAYIAGRERERLRQEIDRRER